MVPIGENVTLVIVTFMPQIFQELTSEDRTYPMYNFREGNLQYAILGVYLRRFGFDQQVILKREIISK
jgi:hypothetical protein